MTFIRYRRALLPRTRRLRREGTPSERKLWYEFLRYLPQKFTRQKPLDRYIADFYCSSCRLVIELDGDSHFTASGTTYDVERTGVFQALGLRVLRFGNAEVLDSFESVCMEIRRALES